LRISTEWLAALLCACLGCAGADTGNANRSLNTGDAGASLGRGGTRADGSGGPTDNPKGVVVLGDGGHANVVPLGCGNGMRSADEACDDGNTHGGDGCSADCLGIEPGFSCQPPGKACRVIARCGDGIVASSEACDDGNKQDADGCSKDCKVELGFQCSAEPSACTKTTCGDNQREGTESCDDGNGLPFDGCSSSCQTEPNCKAGACSSKCGDGLVLDEDCDDGNTKDGDGCSSTCKVEMGFKCAVTSPCEQLNGQCVLRVPAIFRDFDVSHPDFGVNCDGLVKGIVNNTLSAAGTPELANGSSACIQSASTFAEWYTDKPDNATIVGELALYDNGHGGFVNRYGPNGEQWAGPMQFTNVMFGGPGGTGCGMCTPSATGKCFDPCTPWGAGNTQACCADAMQMFYDGTPLFFPIDNAPNALHDMRYRAKVPEQYGYNGWPWEDSLFPGAPAHDFHFTTQVVYWFKYNAHATAVLDFLGDDDVWVFVNGKLAVDLGGCHVPQAGSVTLDATSAARFGLSDGNVYEVRVFHAERKVEGSSFKLTLSGFDSGRSDCTPICGDGIVTQGEECDDGVNDGGYEECAPGCVLGPRCGDGVMQEGEDCDDGNRRDGDDCGSSCRNLKLL
jgi:fibro-slime domain-containing protein